MVESKVRWAYNWANYFYERGSKPMEEQGTIKPKPQDPKPAPTGNLGTRGSPKLITKVPAPTNNKGTFGRQFGKDIFVRRS